MGAEERGETAETEGKEEGRGKGASLSDEVFRGIIKALLVSAYFTHAQRNYSRNYTQNCFVITIGRSNVAYLYQELISYRYSS